MDFKDFLLESFEEAEVIEKDVRALSESNPVKLKKIGQN